ncbi:hypothetical protein ACIG0D_09430 [Streptomyces sp. NPDC052773]|jgi:MFS superfamily sulfate permease-like transporter|uniref:hypothetical protein n=1 Tax=Streptomyces sp. NPDC052773 TaxID=3365693 RepID=UPI0037CEBDB9
MTLTALLLTLLLTTVTLLLGAAVLALLLTRPNWCGPVTGALAAMALLATAIGLAVTAAAHGRP